MSRNYFVLSPDRNVLAGRTVSSTAGTPDDDHPLSWLTDLRPAFPIRYPAGGWGVSISVASQAIRLAVLANHSLDAPVTVGGGISGTLTPSANAFNGILLNPFLLLSAAVPGCTTLTFAGTNTGKTMVGEAFAGDPFELTPLQMADASEEYFDNAKPMQGEWMNIPPHDDGIEWRRFGGTQVYSLSDWAKIVGWWEAQRANTRPSVLILDSSVNDARVVLIESIKYKFNDHKSLVQCTLGFLEYPRYRW